MNTRYRLPERSTSLVLSLTCISAWLSPLSPSSYANDAATVEKATQKIIKLPTEGFVWPNQPPKDCPFAQSKQLDRVYFTGTYHTRNYGDTWYPSWASDGNLYSPFADGTTEGMEAICIEDGNYKTPADGQRGDDRRRSAEL